MRLLEPSIPFFKIAAVLLASVAIVAFFNLKTGHAPNALDMTDEAKIEMMQSDEGSLARSLNAIEPTS